MKKLIKSKERVKKHGEVFTPEQTVDNMLNIVDQQHWERNAYFLEPTCGNGNFIIKIIKKKLEYKHSLIDALETTWGFDIQLDNIVECRDRIIKEIIQPSFKKINKNNLKKYLTCIAIVNNNIKHTDDSLKENWSEVPKSFFDLSKKDQDKKLKEYRKYLNGTI
jgi:hypothetical protein